MVYCYFIGSMKDKGFRGMVEDYHGRLKRLWPVTLVEVPEQPKKIEKLLADKKERGSLVSLDAHGESMNSGSFTKWVTQSSKDIHFFAWGADGPPPAALKMGLKSISLSAMTYPHELARVLLLEQLYRAGATLKGHPYPR